MVADLEAAAGSAPEAEPRAPFEVDRRLHQHPAESAVVRGPEPERQPQPRPRELDVRGQLPVEVVLARDRLLADLEAQARLMLRHAPDPLAALDGDLGADGQVQDVLAEPEGAAAAGERDAVLDVVPD